MSRAATTAVKNIQNFQNTMRDVKSKEVLQRAKDSRAQNPDGIRTWEVTEHADWLETRAEVDVKELRIREKSVGEEQLRVEELRTAVEKLNARKGEVLARIEGERMIQVSFLEVWLLTMWLISWITHYADLTRLNFRRQTHSNSPSPLTRNHRMARASQSCASRLPSFTRAYRTISLHSPRARTWTISWSF